MEAHTHNVSRQVVGLLAVTDNAERTYDNYVVEQAREALERSEREAAWLLSRAFGEQSTITRDQHSATTHRLAKQPSRAAD